MTEPVFSSFRDPSGFVFRFEGEFYRQINRVYADTFASVREAGLYADLVKANLLLPFEELPQTAWPNLSDAIRAVIKLEKLPFISYPYEWGFRQLQDAALLTLEVNRRALDKGFMLKDASAYNIQFIGGRAVFIDQLSFCRVDEYPAWPGYAQFCRHFLAPLALMSLREIPFSAFFKQYIDGPPLALAARMLPLKAWLRPGFLLHIIMHAGFQKKYAASGGQAATGRRLSLKQLKNLTLFLRDLVEKLTWRPAALSEWGDYYSNTNYSPSAMTAKQQIINELAAVAGPRKILDIGGNDGAILRSIMPEGAYGICCDIDPVAVEKCYLRERQGHDILPLLQDLANPSPSLGFASQERDSFISRCRADLVLALALVHHLAISNNLPLPYIADFLASLGDSCVVEFVPKSDSQVQRLLATRQDIFPDYSEQGFEAAFGRKFSLSAKRPLPESNRIIYLYRRKKPSGERHP